MVVVVHRFLSDDGTRCEAFEGAYAVLENKEKKTYKAVFDVFNSVLGEKKFVQLTVDFEPGLFGSADESLDSETITGCSFHMAQAQQRKVGKLGFKNNYDVQKNEFDIDLRELLIKIRSIGLIPKKFKELCIEITRNDFFYCNSTNNGKYQTLFDYCYNTWLSPNARYSIKFWDISDTSKLTTNNATEGINNKLNKKLNRSISILTWITELSKIEVQTKFKYEEMKRGAKIKKKRKNYVDNYMKRKEIVDEMNNLQFTDDNFDSKFDKLWQRLALSVSQASSNWNSLKDLHTDAFLGK